MTAHRSRQLDGQVSQTADAHNTDTIRGADAILSQNGPNSGTSTHQGCRIAGVITIGNRHHTACVPNDSFTEGSKVMIVISIFFLVLTVLVPS